MVEELFYDLEMDAMNLESFAERRRLKAEEYPWDAQRNLDAAELLETLAQEIRALAGSDIHRKLDAVAKNSEGLSSFFKEWNAYVSHIGFHEFPSDGRDLLNDMLKTMLAWSEPSKDLRTVN